MAYPNAYPIVEKIKNNIICEVCDYKCCYQSEWDRHILTRKHKMLTLCDKNAYNFAKNTCEKNKEKIKNQETKYVCDCGKTYLHKQSLWRHKTKCHGNTILANSIPCNTNTIYTENDTKMDKDELIIQLLKQNSELLEIMKNGTNNTTHVNSHNKTFNLQVFLNETCKDAMNINDFVDSIKLQLSDFERMGEVGYAQGISDIITSNLQALDITQRPVHCTDKKRETMYVKDQDQWMKEDDNKSKIKKMIKRIENKNIQIIPQFQKKYPNYANPKSHESDKYHKTIIEVMGGAGGSEGKEGKIIRNISKVTTIREKE
jgi:hypothetical protein